MTAAQAFQSPQVDTAIRRALAQRHFFVAPPAALRIEPVADESIRWELFRGQLLDAAHTRQMQRFASWHVFLDDAGPTEVPLLSLRWQHEAGRIFVTRQILCRGFEAYEDQPGVILSRPVEKWVSELVGSTPVDGLDEDVLARALERLLYLAVTGTSRLPITSLETPLPAFSLGKMAYLPLPADADEQHDESQPATDPLAFLASALAGPGSVEQQAAALETTLRASSVELTPRVAAALKPFFSGHAGGAERLGALLRAVFNGVALSPYTHFADALVGLISELAATAWFGRSAALDAVAYMLRNLCRHLTAFDLTLFHSFGANYPDALFLEALLTAFLDIAAAEPALVLESGSSGRLRRRAVRQAALARRHYEGHRVPDAPTSMGENVRVLPEPFAHVPEEQIRELGKRRRKLFVDRSTDEALAQFGRRALAAAVADLNDPRELWELGMAHFLDRPLGVLKGPGEADRTPLVSYEAFSRSIARGRIRELAAAGWVDAAQREALLAAVDKLAIAGVPVADLAPLERPGVVSIADAGKAAADFVLLRTLPRSLAALLSHYDLHALANAAPEVHAWLARGRDVLFVQCVTAQPDARLTLRIYRESRPQLELSLGEPSAAHPIYVERNGVELPPFEITQIVDANGKQNLAERPLRVEPRWVL